MYKQAINRILKVQANYLITFNEIEAISKQIAASIT